MHNYVKSGCCAVGIVDASVVALKRAVVSFTKEVEAAAQRVVETIKRERERERER